jgi:hypothetical protein
MLSEAQQTSSDVGILFLHGIGGQDRGQTLLHFGEPIYDWLKKWVDSNHRRLGKKVTWSGVTTWLDSTRSCPPENESIGITEAIRSLLGCARVSKEAIGPDQVDWTGPAAASVEFETAHLKTRSEADPAHARLVMTWVDVNGGVTERSWLMAESFWAEVFYPPRFRQLAVWGIDALCWTVGSHYAAQVRRAGSEFWSERGWVRKFSPGMRLFSSVSYLLVGLMLAAMALLTLFVLLVLAIPPIAKLRSWALASKPAHHGFDPDTDQP